MGEYKIYGELINLEPKLIIFLKIRGMWNLSVQIRMFLIWEENVSRVYLENKQMCLFSHCWDFDFVLQLLKHVS